MESDTEEGVPELTKNETKIIQDVISELSEDPYYITSGDQLFSLFSRFQVQPEKQLKIMFAVAFELSELSESCEGEMSDQYLRLSTLATVAVQEKFGQCEEKGGRKTRTAKNNAKINMSSYYDTVEPTLFNESSDEDSAKKKRKKVDKVEWSDSELKETAPIPRSPKPVESIDESGSEGSDQGQPTRATSSQKESNVRQSQRKKGQGVPVICIDSSDEDEAMETSLRPQKTTTQSTNKTKDSNSSKRSPKPVRPPTKATAKAIIRKKPGRKPKPPAISENSVNKLLTSSDKGDKTVSSPRLTKSATKPVGVVTATPRVTPDTKRSTNNTIKQDEALILNFKKGHYPTFQNSYTHLVVSPKPNNDLYTDTAPNVSEVLALDGQVVPSGDLQKYVLKQFVHNDSGQFLVGELDGNLFVIIPGIINKNKDKT